MSEYDEKSDFDELKTPEERREWIERIIQTKGRKIKPTITKSKDSITGLILTP